MYVSFELSKGALCPTQKFFIYIEPVSSRKLEYPEKTEDFLQANVSFDFDWKLKIFNNIHVYTL